MVFCFIGATEIAIILIIALLVFGPQKLPEVGKQIGSVFKEMNRMRGDMERLLDIDDYTNRYDRSPYYTPAEQPIYPQISGPLEETKDDAVAGDLHESHDDASMGTHQTDGTSALHEAYNLSDAPAMTAQHNAIIVHDAEKPALPLTEGAAPVSSATTLPAPEPTEKTQQATMSASHQDVKEQ